MRRMPLRVVKKILFCSEVIGSVGRNGVVAPELIRHCLWRLAPSCLKALGRVRDQPEDVILATVRLPPEPVAILLTQIEPEDR